MFDDRGQLLSPLSLHADGNERELRHGLPHTLPVGGGLTAGLHYSVFTMQGAPAPVRGSSPYTVSTGPTPQDVLAAGKKKRGRR